jgi:hypothetical protein
MQKRNGKLTGILGTVIIHLIAGIIFISLKISSLKDNISIEYEIELAPAPVAAKINEKQKELALTSIEKIFRGDEEMLNIARNLANKSEEKIDPADVINKVKEELIKSGKLGADNFIDAVKKNIEDKNGNNSISKVDSSANRPINKPKESQKMEANYKGPTRIYYDLARRNHLYLPIPIYKCQGSGLVVLSIEVNQQGIVSKAVVITNESTATDPCLIETAVSTALISRFNPDAASPGIQTGTLSYQFVAQ